MLALPHPNRKNYNWLIYQISDKFLLKFTDCYKGRLYDFGCGQAPYREFFQRYSDEYITVDWGETFHDARPDISADLNGKLPIDSAVADSAVCLSVLEHLCEPQHFLFEVYRVLKPGAYFVLQVPWQWWIHEAPHDYFRYTPYALEKMFARAGFIDVRIEAQCGFFSTWLLKVNYFLNRLIRGGRFLQWMMSSIVSPIWYINQKIAPWLDSLDHNWPLETCGFFVVAQKPLAENDDIS